MRIIFVYSKCFLILIIILLTIAVLAPGFVLAEESEIKTEVKATEAKKTPAKPIPTCTQKDDERERKVCDAKTKSNKKGVKYVLKKSVVGTESPKCVYTCVPTQANLCGEKETIVFTSGNALYKGKQCVGCEGDSRPRMCDGKKINHDERLLKYKNPTEEELRNLLNGGDPIDKMGAKELGLKKSEFGPSENEIFYKKQKITTVPLSENEWERATPKRIESSVQGGKVNTVSKIQNLNSVPKENIGTSKIANKGINNGAGRVKGATKTTFTGAGVKQASGALATKGNTKFNTGGNQKIKTGSPYRSFEQPKALAQKPRSFIQRFVGGDGGVADRLNRFVTGNNGAGELRNTPQGDPRGGVQPRVVYVTPEFATPASINREFRSIQDIASDIALQTPSRSLTRVDHFAQTLTTVGGPSKSRIDTENKAFGRIQDLIVEDEAIRALRVAEEEGKRAKNAVFCRVNEEAEHCEQRREEKAQEVERRVFTQELEERVLPQGAIQHFLAVYDGWVRPSPAPKTRATSTLGALHAQDLNPTADYERVTDGTNFVLWVIDSVADATTNAVSRLTNLILGDDKDNVE